MSSRPSEPVSEMLDKWRSGDAAALGALLPLVYDELRRIARRHLKSERPGHTLQCTALVHEAFLRLSGQGSPQIENRAHFFAIAARVMRQVLVDHAREKRAAKRSGGTRITLDEFSLTPERPELDVIALNDALVELTQLDERGVERGWG